MGKLGKTQWDTIHWEYDKIILFKLVAFLQHVRKIEIISLFHADTRKLHFYAKCYKITRIWQMLENSHFLSLFHIFGENRAEIKSSTFYKIFHFLGKLGKLNVSFFEKMFLFLRKCFFFSWIFPEMLQNSSIFHWKQAFLAQNTCKMGIFRPNIGQNEDFSR